MSRPGRSPFLPLVERLDEPVVSEIHVRVTTVLNRASACPTPCGPLLPENPGKRIR
jgi:hypothetical protein